jgi:cytochrome c peroxidase
MTRTRLTAATLIVSGVTTIVLTLAGTRTFTQAQLAPLPAAPAAPADNPTTPEKVALGRMLFWDPILSASSDVACATCHHPSFGYADGLDVAIGADGVGLGSARHFALDRPARFVKRNSPTVLNAAFNGIDTQGAQNAAASPMFWDERVHSLEAQALEPLKALEEMRGDHSSPENAVDDALARVAAVPEYRRLFVRAFGLNAAIDARNLSRALAAFERTLVAVNSPFDRYMRGDSSAMTDEQIRGMNAFQVMGCVNCHAGPMFSDYQLHVLGVPENGKLTAPDTGADDRYAFRTPTLRNLAYTAPYMHDGVFASLDAVLNFYNQVGGRGRGGRGFPPGPGAPPPPGPGAPGLAIAQNGPPRFGGPGGFGRAGRGRGAVNPNVPRQDLDPLLRQVNVRFGSRQDLIAFLGALNDPGFDRTVPTHVPSGLAPGGRLN